ncbi:hypothetical protein M885DRAFT_32512 [Pelagophyceae sp. CCMP2097]|nr:hypothetical protein M885DRAFT_32512 [Pelagophyceae sp. CCMP2097]
MGLWGPIWGPIRRPSKGRARKKRQATAQGLWSGRKRARPPSFSRPLERGPASDQGPRKELPKRPLRESVWSATLAVTCPASVRSLAGPLSRARETPLETAPSRRPFSPASGRAPRNGLSVRRPVRDGPSRRPLQRAPRNGPFRGPLFDGPSKGRLWTTRLEGPVNGGLWKRPRNDGRSLTAHEAVPRNRPLRRPLETAPEGPVSPAPRARLAGSFSRAPLGGSSSWRARHLNKAALAGPSKRRLEPFSTTTRGGPSKRGSRRPFKHPSLGILPEMRRTEGTAQRTRGSGAVQLKEAQAGAPVRRAFRGVSKASFPRTRQLWPKQGPIPTCSVAAPYRLALLFWGFAGLLLGICGHFGEFFWGFRLGCVRALPVACRAFRGILLGIQTRVCSGLVAWPRRALARHVRNGPCGHSQEAPCEGP